MSEKLNQWPRVHSCLYSWCPKQSDECKRCDAVINILIKHDKDMQHDQMEQPEIC